MYVSTSNAFFWFLLMALLVGLAVLPAVIVLVGQTDEIMLIVSVDVCGSCDCAQMADRAGHGHALAAPCPGRPAAKRPLTKAKVFAATCEKPAGQGDARAEWRPGGSACVALGERQVEDEHVHQWSVGNAGT